MVEETSALLLGERLARIETQQLAEMKANQEFRQDLKEDVKDHEGRIRVLEKSLWKYAGISAASSATASILASLIVSKWPF